MPRLRMSYSNRIFVYLPVGLLLLLVLRFLEHLAHRRKLTQPDAADKVPG